MCEVICSQCGDSVNPTQPHARRGDVVTCELCEWPQKRNLEESVIQALKDLPDEGPLLAFVNKARSPLWRRVALLLGTTTLTPEKAWHKLIRTSHPMLETDSTEDGQWLVRLRNQVDRTQGFTDSETYGPPYPVHPEKSYRDHPMVKSLRDKNRRELKRPRGTQHRCVCGAWVPANYRGSINPDHGRRNLFGRCWCKKCAAGHNPARCKPDSDTAAAVFSNADSEYLMQQLEQHYRQLPSDKQAVLVLSHYEKSAETLIHRNWRFVDFPTASARMLPALKPKHRKQLVLFIASNPK